VGIGVSPPIPTTSSTSRRADRRTSTHAKMHPMRDRDRTDGLDVSFVCIYNVLTSEDTMKARIVQIGNSRGIRIPKPLIEQTGMTEEVEMTVEEDRIIIARADRPRASWPAAFREMARAGDDALIDTPAVKGTLWDDEEWEWR
jgi:antitoxin MazE